MQGLTERKVRKRWRSSRGGGNRVNCPFLILLRKESQRSIISSNTLRLILLCAKADKRIEKTIRVLRKTFQVLIDKIQLLKTKRERHVCNQSRFDCSHYQERVYKCPNHLATDLRPIYGD